MESVGRKLARSQVRTKVQTLCSAVKLKQNLDIFFREINFLKIFASSARDEREVVPYSPRFHDGWSPGVISFAPPDPPQRKRSDVTVKSNR